MDKNKDKYYGIMFGFILADAISNKYNIHLENRTKLANFEKTNYNISYHSHILLILFKTLLKNSPIINYDKLCKKLYKWYINDNYKSINSTFAVAMNNYKTDFSYKEAKNGFTDYFGLIYLPIYIVFKAEKYNLYKLTHSLPIFKLLTNVIFFFVNNNNKEIPEIFKDVIDEPFVGSLDAFESLRCAIKAFIHTNSFIEGLLLLIRSVEYVQPSCILYGIIAGNYYGLTGIFNMDNPEYEFDIKNLKDYKKYLALIDKGWESEII